MLYKLHYFCIVSGMCAIGILLGVFMDTYTDATASEIGLLYMIMPFAGMASRPIICSYADRSQAHRQYLIVCQLICAISFFPFILIPYLGPEFHTNHPRFCWYVLVSFKVVGDVAIGGVISIGDSLAINYAKRIGTEFNVYRIWGTISWMVFGFTVGQLNEIWFLPKYAAGFMVLVASSLLDAFICYLWPKEYFVMVTPSMMEKENKQHQLEQEKRGKIGLDSLTRSLLPKEVVFAHAKKQLWALVTFGCFSSSIPTDCTETVTVGQQRMSSIVEDPDSAEKNSKCHQKTLEDGKIDKKTQLSTLFLLLRRDPRVFGYWLVFLGAGAVLMTLSFFFMSLEKICNTSQACEFSKLGGYLQVSMAFIETCLFVFIKPVILLLGRLNTLSIVFSLATCKFAFYATIWPSVNPHWSLLSESVSGIIFGSFLTVMVEMAHLFSCEVEPLIPELVERGIIKDDTEETRERLKLSLSATMQAVMASANDGLGRGLAALLYGRIVDIYSYHTLWLVVAYGSGSIVAVLQIINIAEFCCGFKPGLEDKTGQNQNGKVMNVEEVKTISNLASNIENGLQRQNSTNSKGSNRMIETAA